MAAAAPPVAPPAGSALLRERNIITQFNPDTSVYFMRGHGCDWDDGDDEHIVPPNCSYITAAVCGNAYWMDDNSRKFQYNFTQAKESLKHPSDGIDKYGNHIHVKPAAKTYFNTIFTPYIEGNLACGLYRIGSDLAKKDMEDGEEEFRLVNDTHLFGLVSSIESDVDDIKQRKIRTYFLNLYTHSLFPTRADVERVLGSFPAISTKAVLFEKTMEYESAFRSIIKEHFRVDLTTLFQYFPGIVYNFSCRSPCGSDRNLQEKDPMYPKHVLRRTYSEEAAAAAPAAGNKRTRRRRRRGSRKHRRFT
jgi:hypothetical protein